MPPITAITAYSKAQATYVMDRLHDVFKPDRSGRSGNIVTGWSAASCGYTSTHWAPGESVDVIAEHARDLYDLKAVEHTQGVVWMTSS